MLTKEQKAASHKKIGRMLGFPECCVQEFAKTSCQTTKNKYPKGPWIGTGYIPCADCAEKCMVNFSQFVGQYIDSRRQVPQPFPDSNPAFFKKMWKDAEQEDALTRKLNRKPYSWSISLFGAVRISW